MRAEFLEDHNDSGCCWKGCSEEGEYPAPKSRHNRHERYHFCLHHIKLYNKGWDFFAGMSSEDIEAFQTDSMTGHRPTFRRDTRRMTFTDEDIYDALEKEFSFDPFDHITLRQPPKDERSAMKTLGLRYPVTLQDIKTAYKALAKRYHPDAGDCSDEERFKAVNEAYRYLKGVYGN